MNVTARFRQLRCSIETREGPKISFMRRTKPVHYKSWNPTRGSVVALFAALLCSELGLAQKPEYEFYYRFRTEFTPALQEANHWSLSEEQVFGTLSTTISASLRAGLGRLTSV